MSVNDHVNSSHPCVISAHNKMCTAIVFSRQGMKDSLSPVLHTSWRQEKRTTSPYLWDNIFLKRLHNSPILTSAGTSSLFVSPTKGAKVWHRLFPAHTSGYIHAHDALDYESGIQPPASITFLRTIPGFLPGLTRSLKKLLEFCPNNHTYLTNKEILAHFTNIIHTPDAFHHLCHKPQKDSFCLSW